MGDWYRQKSWTIEIKKFFFLKLNRARKDSRAQYLKIQAIELVNTNNETLLEVAEFLLLKLLTAYPDDKFNRSESLTNLGNIYSIRKNPDMALAYYKEAIDFEESYPNVKTQAYLYFAELVIKTARFELYDFAERLINDRINSVLFPVEKYKCYLILSIISAYNKNPEQSILYAKLADQNANENTSGIKYHKYLGIVKKRDAQLDKLVKGNYK